MEPRSQEAIIDHGIAEQSGIRIGDTVEILGEEFTVAGLSEGTANLTSSVAFIARADFARLRGEAATTSYVLVTVAPGQSPEADRARAAPQRGDRLARPAHQGDRRPGAVA